eukprot:6211196-Pleurochrysis_carterae.AAC.4
MMARLLKHACRVAAPVVTMALEAKWTPAAGAGSARFSKKYRDAEGIDDSRWLKEDPLGSWMPSLLPETAAGWVLAIFAVSCMFLLLASRTAVSVYSPPGPGYTTGGSAAAPGSGNSRSDAAAEAAREAFLKRYN